ncbi:MAG TPA: hypothetical protein PLG21_18025 [Anaerolineae bacterium]|nr:hypothetical protein [Anaerolineae bacterium]
MKAMEQHGLAPDQWIIQTVGPGVTLEAFITENESWNESAKRCGCSQLGHIPVAGATGSEAAGNSLASVGARYRAIPSTFESAISTERAITLAKARVAPRLLEPNVDEMAEAALVLFSNDQYCTENERGETTYHHQDIPAWIVTFRDVTLPMSGPRGTTGGSVYNTEVNVAIDAVTGSTLELYTYR